MSPGSLGGTQKHKKKVFSKPIENINELRDKQMSSLALAYEF